jgi:hypothetical protein
MRSIEYRYSVSERYVQTSDLSLNKRNDITLRNINMSLQNFKANVHWAAA